MNSTSLTSSEGGTMISMDTDGKMVIVSSIKQEPEDCPEITEESFDKFSESESSPNYISHVKQEPELSIVSKLPPVIEHEEELKKLKRKRLSVNLRKFDAKWIQKTRLFETFVKCPKCQIVTKNSYAEKHMMACRGPIPDYHCYRCQESFKLKRTWKIHMGKHMRKICKKECKDCGQKFKTWNSLARHREIMGEHKNFNCPKCSFVGKNLTGLKAHSFIHIDETFQETSKNTPVFKRISTPYECNKCGQKFDNEAKILVHQNRMGNHKCMVCDQEFECMYAKNKHFRDAHGLDFKCQKCSYVGSNFERLRGHAYRFHKTLENKFSCDKFEIVCSFCSRIFPTEYKLFEHLKSCHKRFECCICGEVFSMKNDARQHMIDTHLNERQPKNSTELHSVTASEALKCHDYCRETRWIQSGNYQCYQCKETFDSRKLLNCHNAKHHPITCGYCGKKFYHKYNLYKHQSIINCKCVVCDEKFKCREGLDKHYQSAHANKLCHKCPFVGGTITKLTLHCLTSHQTPVESQPTLSNRKFQSDFDNADSNENSETLITFSGFYESSAIPETKTSGLDCHVLNVEQEQEDCLEIIDGESDFTNPEIEEFLETSQNESSTDHISHVKQEPELSIVSKLPPVAEHEEELRKQLTVNLRDSDAKVENSAEKHVMTCPGPISPTIYQCDRCQESFNSREHWQDHIRQHKPKGKPQCDCCGQKFDRNSQVLVHQNQMGNYKCVVCDTEFKCKYARMQHFRDAHGQDFKCPKCPYVGKNLNTLKQHSEVHIDKKKIHQQIVCGYCGKEFKHKNELTTHQLYINRICLMCDKEYECPEAINKHYQSAHDDKIYLCPKCPFIGKTISALKLHYLTKHQFSETTTSYQSINGKQ